MPSGERPGPCAPPLASRGTAVGARGGMARALTAADTAAVLALLRARPLHNVFLEHVIRSGALGRVPGFFGYDRRGALEGVLMLGPLGGTSLAVRHPDAFGPLAERAGGESVRPRHIVGSEDLTVPFWAAYERHAARVIWCRREPVYVMDRACFAAARGSRTCQKLRAAGPADLGEVVENSARQHREDLADDRYTTDPEGFRRRHEADLLESRWWVLRERKRICFQVHVGPANAEVVQVGGVFTPPELRGRGYATRGIEAIVAQLLERWPAVSLFCSEDNHAARRVYEKVGFREAFSYRSWLLDEPTGAACRGLYA